MQRKTKQKGSKKIARTHMRQFHALRLSCFGLLAAGLLIIQVATSTQQAMPAIKTDDVLGYATNVTIGDLLAATNAARKAHGMGTLGLNSKLNNGAQAKAQDMIAKNYWSHNAPDGTQPWVFFTNAGYKYSRAGENLAYGFDASNQVVDAWMNSAGHKANILGAYTEIGFGIANGPTYQGGENTVIVAFYATPFATAPKPTPAATTPTPAPKPAPKPLPSPTPAPKPAEVAKAPEQKPAETPKEEKKEQVAQAAPPAPAQEPKKVTALDAVLGGQASWATYASLGLVGTTSLGFAATHLQLMRRGWRHSIRFVHMHPALDMAIVAAILAILLTSTAGFIK